jgi:hypothetical protein
MIEFDLTRNRMQNQRIKRIFGNFMLLIVTKFSESVCMGG